MRTLDSIAIELKDALTEGVRDGNFPSLPYSEGDDLTEAWKRLSEREEPRLRLSFGSRCPRRMWYSHHKPETAIPPDPEAFVGFSMGDWWELIAYHAISSRLLLNKSNLDLSMRGREVEMDGIKGHIDGLVSQRHESIEHLFGGPSYVVDFKSTSKWVHRRWENGMPDPTWGYLHQAANYMEALRQDGAEVEGFIWIVYLKDVGGFETGIASREQLAPYLTESRDFFEKAKADTPPPRCEGYPDSAPCRGKARVYCPFYTTCENDHA